MWMLHYDHQHVDVAWEKLKKAYFAKEIDGLIRISCTRHAINNCKVIYCFVGPADNQTHCRAVGRRIIEVMNYARQDCHQDYPPFIYYKVPKIPGPLYKESFSRE
jgi:hypothetical protein